MIAFSKEQLDAGVQRLLQKGHRDLLSQRETVDLLTLVHGGGQPTCNDLTLFFYHLHNENTPFDQDLKSALSPANANLILGGYRKIGDRLQSCAPQLAATLAYNCDHPIIERYVTRAGLNLEEFSENEIRQALGILKNKLNAHCAQANCHKLKNTFERELTKRRKAHSDERRRIHKSLA